ncbi:HK97-gp10 family putative phage morphogenesis protein [[Ruminococcus] torques]|uniref:HK97-gp10 family putative phage morphogenesis protein n=1 Tax=[Ruminococcus] torques TaxID=33039 RepID=UPI003AB63296
MSFNITMRFEGLEETYREIQKLSTEAELKELNKKIVKKAGKIAQEEAKGQIKKKAYSENPMKSGRKGSRTGQHAADNVPKKAATQSGNYGEVIGWEVSDTSPFFYMKFHEWGTSIHKPKEFMLEAAHATYPQLKQIAEEEYEKVLKEKLGG